VCAESWHQSQLAQTVTCVWVWGKGGGTWLCVQGHGLCAALSRRTCMCAFCQNFMYRCPTHMHKQHSCTAPLQETVPEPEFPPPLPLVSPPPPLPHPPPPTPPHPPQGQEKMSKSDPNSAIFMEDSEGDVNVKIKKAYCPPQVRLMPLFVCSLSAAG
jgi:hypothetical protein